MKQDALFLREQAQKCRRLAKSINDQKASATLLGMANDYEKRADEIGERSVPKTN